MTQKENKSGLPEGWKEARLWEVIDKIIDNRWRNPKEYFDIWIPVIDNYLITWERKIDLWKVKRFINNETYNNFIRKYSEEWDVLVTLVWNWFWNTSLHPKEKSVIIQNTIWLRANNLADNQYIYYYLLKNKKKITDLNRWAAQPSVKVWDLLDISIWLPPLPTQKSISNILSSFDDKIELLREQNETLEKIWQEIFKEWFGKYKVWDELPEGWRVGKLWTEFDITIWRTPPRKEKQWFSNIPVGKKWISIKDMGDSWTYIYKSSEYLTNEAIDKFNIPIIPKNTVILSFKMTVWKLVITTEEMLSNEAIAHLKVKEDSFIIPEFIYLALQSLDFNTLWSTSSIVTSINTGIIKNIDLIIPSKKSMLEFKELIQPIFEKIKINSEQIKSISITRDELLPKLMKGKVLVNDL
jgi:type I restriction enzyme, S subunit